MFFHFNTQKLKFDSFSFFSLLGNWFIDKLLADITKKNEKVFSSYREADINNDIIPCSGAATAEAFKQKLYKFITEYLKPEVFLALTPTPHSTQKASGKFSHFYDKVFPLNNIIISKDIIILLLITSNHFSFSVFLSHWYCEDPLCTVHKAFYSRH